MSLIAFPGGDDAQGHPFRLAVVSLVLGLMATSARAQFCFVNHVARKGQSIELYFEPGSNVFARISREGQGIAATDRMYQQQGDQMHRMQANAQLPDMAVSSVVIFPGEGAFVA